MDIEDKRYWIEEAMIEIGALREGVATVREVDDLTSVLSALSEVLDDLIKLEHLEQ